MKKQFIVMASLATILGLSFYSATHIHLDGEIGKKDEDKSYIVLCDGDVFKDDAVSLKYNRNKVLNQITYNLPEGSFEVVNTYDTLLNGFEIKINSRYEDYLKSVKGVSEVLASHTYARPETVESGFDSMISTDAGYDTRELRLENYSAQTMDATDKAVTDALKKRGASDGVASQQGKNVTVGIIDTGLYLNQVEGSATREALLNSGTSLNPAAFTDLSSGEYSVTKQDVLDKGFTESYFTHVNNKVFFARDYSGKDNDVDPTANGSPHGTHVASLAAANGSVFQGIAPKAQVAVMKVFPDYDGGASDGAVIAALEDAAKLGLDVVNLSLGTDLNNSEDNTTSPGYIAIQNASKKGVIVNYAAGNSGKSTFSSSASYGDWTRDVVETSILGGDSHFDESANIVAASNPETAFYSSILTVQNKDASAPQAVAYDDQVKKSVTQPNLSDRPLASLLPEGESSKEFDYVVIPGWGKDSDYEAVDQEHGIDTSTNYNPKTDSYVSGKIAVVSRGTTSFVNKYLSAQSHGALALIVINNDPSVTFNFSMDFADNDPEIPGVFVFQNSRTIFGLPDGNKGNEGKLTIATNTAQTASDGNMLASFSSDGGEANLDMGVTVAAPGKEIMGAVSATAYNDGSDAMNPGYSLLTGYENMSGTSMACPNFTGALALYLGERNPENGGTLAVEDQEAFEAEKKLTSMKAMSTTEKLVSTSGNGTYASPRVQGSGRVDVEKMLTSDTYVTVPNDDLQGFENTVQSKAELKNAKSLKVDFSTDDTSENYIEFEYTIHNDSSVERTYTPSLSIMTPSLRIAVSHDEYDAMEESSKAEVIGYDKNASGYPYGVGQITATVNDDLVKKVDLDNIVVPANGVYNGTCKVRIDNIEFEKSFGDSQVEDFKGTLKEYYKKYFENAGGNYIEGYLDFEDASTTKDEKVNLSVPYLGFYGDYTKADAVEPFDFERKDGYLYESDLVSNYMQNLADAYKKPYAYAGSTLAATATGLTSDNFARINNFEESTKPNGTTYLSVTDGKNNDRIYAGAPGVSEHLIGTFFVNRSVSDANYEITTKDGKSVKTDKIADLFTYGTIAVAQDVGELMKSFLVVSGQSYTIHRGYVDINLNDVPEGEYNLKFNFTKTGTGTVQTKQYTLVVDKTAPTLAGLSISTEDGDDRVDIVTHGASYASINVTTGRETEAVEGTDLTSTFFWINDSWKEQDRMFLELTDYAHNSQKILIKPSQIDFSVASTFFTSKNDFDITLINSSNGNYTYAVDILNASTGDSVTRKHDMTIHMTIAKNLNADDIKVYVDGEQVEVTYNAETGLVSFTFGKDSASFTINQAPVSNGNTGDSTTGDSSTGSTDSTTGDSSTGNTTTPEPGKGGCGGSVIIASSTVGALALLGASVALFKKRKSDK